jgi:GAF domain-containing protein
MDRAAALLLELASARTQAALLHAAVGGLAASGAALARIWLLDPGRDGGTLRLAASAGRPRTEARGGWNRTDGAFRTFRVGAGKVGIAASRAAPVAVRDVQRARRRIARPEWALREGIHGFAAIPLSVRGRVLGVLGVFRREPLDDPTLTQLGDLGGHVAAGLERALAFAELELRGEALGRENQWLREALAGERARPRGARTAARGALLTEAELRALERENLARALERSGGRIYGAGGAAELLGLQPTTLASRIRALGVARPGRARH